MPIQNAVPKLSHSELREAIRKEYANVALNPTKGYHFHTGRRLAAILGYNEALYEGLPEPNIASFAGTGNPFSLGPIHPGETVVDIGSGAGFDSLIASRLVGPTGQVIGFDMTEEMLNKARAGAAAMGVTNVEFREGLAESLPLPDEFADMVISNGVLDDLYLIARGYDAVGYAVFMLVHVAIIVTGVWAIHTGVNDR